MQTPQNKRYIAITIGPIDRIMIYTKSLKSFWAASYLMSYIGKTIIRDFLKEGKKRTFIKPYLNDNMWKIHDGVGRFPDQYIFEAEENDFGDLIKLRKSLFKSLSEDISNVLNIDQDIINTYLQNTIKVYICELNDLNPEEAIAEAHKAMDAMECMDCFQVQEEKNYLKEYFEKINESKSLLEDAFNVVNKGRLFKSLSEISTQDSSKENTDSQIAQLDPRYKYVAYVYADGDNVGKAIAKLGDSLSQQLLDFNGGLSNTEEKDTDKKGIISIVEADEGLNGSVIYAGGDDLLFLTPVSSVFDLIDKIDKLFADKILTEEITSKLKEYNLPTPSMSYGVYISYYKHPMGEALAAANNLLYKAKNNGRNRIEFAIRKHSGQLIESFIDKNNDFSDFIKIINVFIGNDSKSDTTAESQSQQQSSDSKKENDNLFLHSLSHFLMTHIDVINHILSTDVNLLDNYFNHTFDDNSHEKYKSIVTSICVLLKNLASSCDNKKDAINQVYSLLRYVELVIAKN